MEKYFIQKRNFNNFEDKTLNISISESSKEKSNLSISKLATNFCECDLQSCINEYCLCELKSFGKYENSQDLYKIRINMRSSNSSEDNSLYSQGIVARNRFHRTSLPNVYHNLAKILKLISNGVQIKFNHWK